MADSIELPEVLITPHNFTNSGGTADSWNPHGSAPSSSDFVIHGESFNQDISTGSVAPSGLPRGYGNTPQAYQTALNQAGVTSVPAGLEFMAGYLGPQRFADFAAAYIQEQRLHASITTPGFSNDVLGLGHPGMRSATRQGTIDSIGNSSVSHSMELWLSTADNPAWFMGSGIDDWPVDLPDWGERPSGPLPSGFSPISGRVLDYAPTEQEILDAGNPATWLLPSQVGPMVRSLSTMNPYGSLVPIDANRTPGDVTPGSTTSAITPEYIQGLFPGNPNMWGLGTDFGGPRTYFGDEFILPGQMYPP